MNDLNPVTLNKKIELQAKLISKNEELIQAYRTAWKEKCDTLDMAITELKEAKELLNASQSAVNLLRQELKEAKTQITSNESELETLRPLKPAQVIYMTQNELKVLKDVNDSWHENEGGYSEFSKAFITISKSVGGTLAQLQSKELIYDCYDGYEDEEPMWCMTQLGASVMISEGHEYDWELIYKDDIEKVNVVIQ